MMRWYDEGPGWGGLVFMGVGMVVFWTVAAVLLYAALRGVRSDTRRDLGGGPPGGVAGTAGPGEARRLLDERFARGEIDPEDYRVRRDLLDR